MCHNIVLHFDADVSAWFRSVANLRFPALLAGFVHGLLVCVATLWLVQHFTGVSWKDFVANIQGRIAVPLLALALMIAVFVTGGDWIRWWTVILINVAAVYPTRRHRHQSQQHQHRDEYLHLPVRDRFSIPG